MLVSCDTGLIRPAWMQTLQHIICLFPVQKNVFSFATSGQFFDPWAVGSGQTHTVEQCQILQTPKASIPFTAFLLGASCVRVLKRKILAPVYCM